MKKEELQFKNLKNQVQPLGSVYYLPFWTVGNMPSIGMVEVANWQRNRILALCVLFSIYCAVSTFAIFYIINFIVKDTVLNQAGGLLVLVPLLYFTVVDIYYLLMILKLSKYTR